MKEKKVDRDLPGRIFLIFGMVFLISSLVVGVCFAMDPFLEYLQANPSSIPPQILDAIPRQVFNEVFEPEVLPQVMLEPYEMHYIAPPSTLQLEENGPVYVYTGESYTHQEVVFRDGTIQVIDVFDSFSPDNNLFEALQVRDENDELIIDESALMNQLLTALQLGDPRMGFPECTNSEVLNGNGVYLSFLADLAQEDYGGGNLVLGPMFYEEDYYYINLPEQYAMGVMGWLLGKNEIKLCIDPVGNGMYDAYIYGNISLLLAALENPYILMVDEN